MKPDVVEQLLAINRQFYIDFGAEFSRTRGRIQPGVRRILDSLKGDETILDLGCGNGELARTLARRGHSGAYLGLDFSPPLLADAESLPAGFPASFMQADLTKLSALSGRLSDTGHWSLVTAFATLHHIPTRELRLGILQKVHALLRSGGRFTHSEWQFLNSPRLRDRVQPWIQTGLAESDLDPGDYLLDWRSGGRGLRYVHHFNEAELADLAESGGFRVMETFYSDGKEGNLAIYQMWQKR